MKNLIEEARLFAIAAHDSVNHRRRYTDEPYHVHPERVAQLLKQVTQDEEIIAAAYLHDVLEDVAPLNAAFNADAIEQKFGKRVLELVLEVSDVSTKADGNPAARKAIDRAHLAKASKAGKLIKLADLIDNIIDISKNDPHFGRVFRKEAKLSLKHLEDVNEQLFSQLETLLNKNY